MTINFAADIYGSSRTNLNIFRDPFRRFQILSAASDFWSIHTPVTPQHRHDQSVQTFLIPGQFRGKKMPRRYIWVRTRVAGYDLKVTGSAWWIVEMFTADFHRLTPELCILSDIPTSVYSVRAANEHAKHVNRVNVMIDNGLFFLLAISRAPASHVKKTHGESCDLILWRSSCGNKTIQGPKWQ